MSPLRPLLFVSLFSAIVSAQDVGSGAPSDGVANQFVNSFYRGSFSRLVALPPATPVQKFGPAGYAQEFLPADRLKTGHYALVKADATSINNVYQVSPSIFALYSATGAATAGYPTMDTGGCPATTATVSCEFQTFTKNYAIFGGDTAFTLRDPFYTRWSAIGGITGLGSATSAETSVTSKFTTTATEVRFTSGAIYSITSGLLTGKLFAVGPKIAPLYTVQGGSTGALGLPTSDELQIAQNKFRQTFEGGAIEYTPGSDPVLRPAVGGVTLSVSTAGVLRMNLNDSLVVRATIVSTIGGELTDRDVSWLTSNGRVVAIQPSGVSATLRAVGGGTAIVTASSDGKISPQLTIFVSAPCCQIGEGAPTPAIQQAFQDAVTQYRLNLRLPASNPVHRVAGGYVQEVQGADAGATRYLLAKLDRLPGVYVVTGAILTAYDALGGPAGNLGYPIAAATEAGRQLFENGALAGSPSQLVQGAILTRWAADGYETGSLGLPISDSVNAMSFTGSTGRGQAFRGGAIYVIDSGVSAGRTYTVRSAILAAYAPSGAAAGRLGFPTSEELTDGAIRRQEFEGGTIAVAEGSEPEVTERERTPRVTAFPSTVTAGGQLRVTIGGFADGATLRVSFPGQQGSVPFTIRTATGSYSWLASVPAASRSGPVAIHAEDANGGAAADGSYTVRALADSRLQLLKVRGDTQTGMPGARLPVPLQAQLKDENGNPLPGIEVAFTPSPGGQIVAASAVTDSQGIAEAFLRLPPAEGIALVNVEASRLAVTFSARVAAGSLTNFPKLMATGPTLLGNGTAGIAQKGALLAAAASILRYFQNRGDLPMSQGLADPAVLNEFLKSFCVFDFSGAQICDGFLTPAGPGDQVVNLWRLGAFAGNNLDVVAGAADEIAIRDSVAQGIPVLVALSLTADDQPLGSHFVVATGVQGGGSIQIHDPNPVLSRRGLTEYLDGFAAGGHRYQAAIISAVSFFPRPPSPTGFLAASASGSLNVLSPAGPCGVTLEWPGAAIVIAGAITAASSTVRLRYCAGSEALYQLDVSSESSFSATVTDLGSPGRLSALTGNGSAAYKLTRIGAQWAPNQLDASIQSNGIVNAASLAPGIAPGGLAAIFGSGLAAAGGSPSVTIGDRETQLIMASPFQVNIFIPVDLQPGLYTLRIQSPFGAVEQEIELLPAAPGIFRDAAGKPMVVNQDGKQNSAANPVARGRAVSIYATGLGALAQQGNQIVPQIPVVAVLQGLDLPVTARLSPDIAGIYVVNLVIPASAAPGLELPLLLRAAGVDSNSVEVSIQ